MKTPLEQSNTASKKHKSRKQLGASLALVGALSFGAGNANAQTPPSDTLSKQTTSEQIVPTPTQQLKSEEKTELKNDAFLNLYQGI
jgi:hypothetical protein